jgi:uncharacterized protein DUF397
MNDLTRATWRKSSFSGSGNACVEVADLVTRTAVRDSKLGDGSPVLSVTATQWAAFTAGLRSGQFD